MPLPEPTPRDARTTPGWLRLPALALLPATAAYLGLAYHHALEEDVPDWLRRNPYSLWMGTWQMFTYRDPGHSTVVAGARFPGEEDWVAVPLEELFPYQWESGYRYSRSSFKKSSSRMRTLAQATCFRMERRPERVRFIAVRWDKTLGSKEQPFKRKRESAILDWDCEDSYRLPQGRVL